MLTKQLQQQLIEKLRIIDPYKVILFGSHAYGTPSSDSDIDLLVVTEDTFLPQSFAEKNAVYLRVAGAIVDIEKRMPIDLLVHTKAMHQKFVEIGGMFARQIVAQGIVLYEKFN